MKRRIFTMLGASLLVLGLNAQDLSRGREVTVPHTDGVTVTIDGQADEAFWSKMVYQEIDTFFTTQPTNDNVIPPDDANDISASFKVAYDDVFFYFYVTAKDDAIVPGTDFNSDNVEIFFNMDPANTGTDGYANLTASQLRFNVGTDDPVNVPAGGYASSAGDVSVNNYEFMTVLTADGYQMEGQIPWSAVYDNNIVPTPFSVSGGAMFEFEIELGDTDDPERWRPREHILMWNGKSNNAWANVDNFGDAYLGVSTGVNEVELGSDVLVRSNAVINEIVVDLSDVSVVKSLSLFNLAGAEVLKTNDVSSTSTLNVGNLPSGIYVLTVNGTNNAKKAFKIVKK